MKKAAGRQACRQRGREGGREGGRQAGRPAQTHACFACLLAAAKRRECA